MVDLQYIKTKMEKGVYLTLKEKREYLKFCIDQGIDNKTIMNKFDNYDINYPQFEFMLNDLRLKSES